MARRDESPCENNCGHAKSDHYCRYKDINTSREAWKCQYCSCKVYPQQMASGDPNFIYVEGVGWDYASNAHKYDKSTSSGRRFLGIF